MLSSSELEVARPTTVAAVPNASRINKTREAATNLFWSRADIAAGHK
jgi:hypothetical protein